MSTKETELGKPAISSNDRLAEVFRTYNGTLVSYLASRLKSRQAAAEIAQEAYVRLLNHPDSAKIIDLKSYLFRIANNIAIDASRRDHMHARALENADVRSSLQEQSIGAGGPENEIAARQTARLLRAAIEELPPKCRTAFILYKLQGESYEDIAERMNLTASMIRKYVIRALRHCRRRLDGELTALPSGRKPG